MFLLDQVIDDPGLVDGRSRHLSRDRRLGSFPGAEFNRVSGWDGVGLFTHAVDQAVHDFNRLLQLRADDLELCAVVLHLLERVANQLFRSLGLQLHVDQFLIRLRGISLDPRNLTPVGVGVLVHDCDRSLDILDIGQDLILLGVHKLHCRECLHANFDLTLDPVTESPDHREHFVLVEVLIGLALLVHADFEVPRVCGHVFNRLLGALALLIDSTHGALENLERGGDGVLKLGDHRLEVAMHIVCHELSVDLIRLRVLF